MDQKKKAYFDELNIFRALLIFWVVVGHSTEEGLGVGGLFHTYAYSFHMYGFFVLSGILFASKLKRIEGVKDMGAAVFERFKRLIIPYLFFSLVSYALKFVFEKYALNSISKNIFLDLLTGTDNPNGGIWFLHALFVISVLAILLCKLPDWLNLTVFTGLYFASPFLAVDGISVLNRTLRYGMFFFFGIFIAKYYGRISEAVCGFFKKRLNLSAALTVVYFGFSLMIVFAVFAKDIKATSYQNFLFLTLVILFNVLVHYLLAHTANAIAPLKKPLTVIGDYGMDIYLIGYYVQIAIRVVLGQMLGAPDVLCSVLMLVFGLLAPIPISKYIIRKFRLTSAVMLGAFPKKDK